MTAGQEMWTPLEAALAPFKDLARLNRQTVTGAGGRAVQIVLAAGRCRVDRQADGDATTRPEIELGFSLGRDDYLVRFAGDDYRRDGRWDFDRIRSDISAGLQSGALEPGAVFALVPG